MDRFIVKDAITEDKVWWGNINIPFDPEKFDQNAFLGRNFSDLFSLKLINILQL